MRSRLFMLLIIALTVTFVGCGRQPDPPQEPLPRTELLRTKLKGQSDAAATAIAVQDKYAYVGIGPRLVLVDISDPSHPAVVGHARLGNKKYQSYNVTDVAVLGDYAYVVADDMARPGRGDDYSKNPDVHVVDISDPAAPHVVGSYGTRHTALGVAVVGHYAYVYDQDTVGGGAASSLRVVDLSDPTKPTEVGYCETPGQGRAPGSRVGSRWFKTGGDCVTVIGGYAYVADFEGGLRVVDVSDPAVPHQVGSLDAAKVRAPKRVVAVAGLAVAGDYAYVTDYWRGLGNRRCRRKRLCRGCSDASNFQRFPGRQRGTIGTLLLSADRTRRSQTQLVRSVGPGWQRSQNGGPARDPAPVR